MCASNNSQGRVSPRIEPWPQLKNPEFWQVPETLTGRLIRIVVCTETGTTADLSRILAAGYPGPDSGPKFESGDLQGLHEAPPNLGEWLGWHSSFLPHVFRYGDKPLTCEHLLWRPLLSAIRQGSADKVELLLNAGAPAWFGGKDFDHPLTLAVNKSHTDIVRLLLDHGAPTWSRDSKYQPLLMAIDSGREEIIALIGEAIKRRGDALPWGRYGGPLGHAADKGDAKTFSLLLPLAGEDDLNDAFSGVFQGKHPDCFLWLEELLRRGANPLIEIPGQPPVLHLLFTSIELHPFFMDAEKNISEPAARLVLLEKMMDHLIAAGASVSSCDGEGRSLTYTAVSRCPSPDILRRLLDAGAPLRHAGDPHSLLHAAAFEVLDNHSMFQYLVGLGFSCDEFLEDTSWLKSWEYEGVPLLPLVLAEWTAEQWRFLLEKHPDDLVVYAEDVFRNPTLPSDLRLALEAARG